MNNQQEKHTQWWDGTEMKEFLEVIHSIWYNPIIYLWVTTPLSFLTFYSHSKQDTLLKIMDTSPLYWENHIFLSFTLVDLNVCFFKIRLEHTIYFI